MNKYFFADFTLRRRLFFLFLGMGVGALLLANVIWLPSTVKDIRKSQAELRTISVHLIRNQIKSDLGSKEDDLRRIAGMFRFDLLYGDRAALSRTAKLFLHRERDFEEIGIIDGQGKEIIRLSRREVVTATDLRDRSADIIFREGMKEELHWAPVRITKTSEPWVTVTIRLPGVSKALNGLVFAVVNLKSLWHLTGEFSLSQGGRAYVVGDRGKLIAADDPSLVLRQLSFAGRSIIGPLIDKGHSRNQTNLEGKYVNEKGIKVRALALSLTAPSWAVAVEQQEDLLLAPVLQKIRLFAVLSLAGIIASFALAWMLSRRIAAPLIRLQEGAKHIGAGNFGYRVSVPGNDEIGQLAESFNHMAERLDVFRAATLAALTVPVMTHRAEQQNLLREVLANILRVTEADAISLRLIGDRQTEFTFSFYHGFSDSYRRESESRTGDAVGEARILKAALPFLIQDVSADAEGPNSLLYSEGFREVVYISLKADNNFLGLLTIAGRRQGRLTTEMADIFQAIGNRLAAALQNVRLFLEVQTSKEELEKRIGQLGEAEKRRLLTITLLNILNSSGELTDAINKCLKSIREYTGFDAIGIRLRDGEDFPYHVQIGFSESFVKEEKFLCSRLPDGAVARDEAGRPLLECTCGLVLNGRTDPANPLFTPRGSFWSNDTTSLLDLSSDEDPRFKPRNNCIHAGYKSVALVPIRRDREIIGLLQMNNRAENSFTPETIGFFEDLSAAIGVAAARLQDAGALQESERNFRSSLDNSPLGVRIISGKGDLLYANQAMLDIYGCGSFEELKNMPAVKRYTPESYADHLERKGKRIKGEYVPPSYEITALRMDGEARNLLVFRRQTIWAGKNQYQAIYEDITEHKKTEEQLRQAQKLESIGTLAGGVAHDFNNIISAVLGYASLTLMNMEDNDPLRTNLEQIVAASDRAATLTQSLLAFSRKQPFITAPVDLCEILRRFEKFIIRLLREDIELKMMYPAQKLTIMADAAQIEQIMMNLTTNARDAMPGGGMLVVTAATTHIDQTFINEHGYGKAGVYARLSFNDSGIGMDSKTKERIFEPFFTTKVQGKGTGLGLSMVYGIVKRHEGYIGVVSEPGKGTTINVYLPIVMDTATVMPAAEAEQATRGTETILVAEDDDALRRLNSKVLEVHGYRVIEAADGAEAVVKYRENKDSIDLVILDVIMPKMNGREAFREMKALRPDILCIYVSGYADDLFSSDGISEDKAEFIQKPFSPSKLTIKVRDVLDKQKPSIGGAVFPAREESNDG